MILLDTHTLIWFLTDVKKLSEKVVLTIEKEKPRLLVSSISIWEICSLVHKKRVQFSQSLEETIKIINTIDELQFVPVDNPIAYLSQNLPGSFHADPADRLIVATALNLGATLLSKDLKIRRYKHVKSLW